MLVARTSMFAAMSVSCPSKLSRSLEMQALSPSSSQFPSLESRWVSQFFYEKQAKPPGANEEAPEDTATPASGKVQQSLPERCRFPTVVLLNASSREKLERTTTVGDLCHVPKDSVTYEDIDIVNPTQQQNRLTQ